MVTFRNNNNGRRNSFRRGDRNFKSNGDRSKFNTGFSSNDNFQRKAPGRNNHNAPKLIEKYNNLAREALSNGDKILSEQEAIRKNRYSSGTVTGSNETENKEKKVENLSDTKKTEKVQSEAN